MLTKLRTLSGTTAQATVLASALVGLVGCSQPSSQNAMTANSDSARIIGGTLVTGKEDFATTIVGLYNVSEGFMCTGSILSDELILTAAHCVVGDAGDTIVIFGNNAIEILENAMKPPEGEARKEITLDEFFEKLSPDVTLRRADAYRVSPIWPARQNEILNTGDIALMRFKGGLVKGFSKATLLADAKQLANGQKVILSGFGVSDQTKGEGSGVLRVVETTIQAANYTQSEILIEQSKGKGACHGDSGGPAYVEIDGKKVVVGVTSRGVNDPKDTCAVSAAYTSVPFYAAWIARTSKLMSTPPVAKNSELPAPAKPAPKKPAIALAAS